MTRSRASARQAGSSFERLVSDYLRDNWSEFIDRRVKTGSVDKGDVANFRVGLHRVVVECKDERKIDLSGWVKEAQKEAINDGALAGIVIAKRRGKGDPADQYCILLAKDLIRLLRAARGDECP